MPRGYVLRRAAAWVRHGGVVAYPTEAVYGLGCDPLNPAAFERLLAIKGRDAGKGVILIAASPAQLAPYLSALPAAREAEILAAWPGPVTWILPAAPGVPDWLTGGRATLAVRVTAHPVAAALCRACGMALVSTSANRSGRAPARSGLQVRLRLGERLDFVVPGSVGSRRRPTTIKNALTGEVIRP